MKKNFSIYLDEDSLKKLRELGNRIKRSVSYLIQEAIDKYLFEKERS